MHGAEPLAAGDSGFRLPVRREPSARSARARPLGDKKGAMRGTPLRYGGIAAVLLWGIGLLAVGRTGFGVGALALGVLAMAIATSPSPSGKGLFLSVGALILSGVLGYRAASNEITGTATCYPSGWKPAERVIRENSPAKFREATNFLWAGSIVCAVAGIVIFRLSRKLDDCAASS